MKTYFISVDITHKEDPRKYQRKTNNVVVVIDEDRNPESRAFNM